MDEIIANIRPGDRKVFKPTTRGQKLETYVGWVWCCSVCFFAYVTSGTVNDDGQHPEYVCPRCMLDELERKLKRWR